MRKLHAFLIVFSLITVVSFGQGYQTPVEGDYVIEDFQFESGESLPKLNLHYRTIGKPTKGTDGKVNNAILIKHGTTGSGEGF
jgi:homoserine O-acetyltransferase